MKIVIFVDGKKIIATFIDRNIIVIIVAMLDRVKPVVSFVDRVTVIVILVCGGSKIAFSGQRRSRVLPYHINE